MGSVADDARQVLRDRFVGRSGEIEAFEGVLGRDGSGFVWVFGPGGIGKSTLLARFRDIAATSGCVTVDADLRIVDPTIDALLASLSQPPAGEGRLVVFIDALERAPAAEDWIRTAALDGYAEGTVVVIASRLPPSVSWRADEVTGPLTTVLAVRGLDPGESSDLLAGHSVPPEDRRRAARISHGHPLALTMLAEALAAGAQLDRLDDAPDLVAMLLTHILGDVPDDAHRRALESCAIARVTTRSLLRSVVPDSDTTDLFDWLASRPYVDRLPDGLCPHDLVRDLIEADLRSCDPERYRALKLSIRRSLLDRRRESGAGGTWASDLIYLHRFSSTMSSFWDWGSFGSAHEARVSSEDHATIERIVGAHNPPELLPVLRHWLRRQPEGFRLVRTGNEVIGMFALLVLDEPRDEDLDHDPGMGPIWEHAHSTGLRPGESIAVQRFFEDRELGQQAPSRTLNVMSASITRHWMLGAQAIDYVACVRDRESWKPMFDYLDFLLAPTAITPIGGVPMGTVYRDWRRDGRIGWLELMESRELGGEVLPPRAPPIISALSESAFADAVRAALRDLARPDRLATSALLASRLVLDQRSADPVVALDRVLREALLALPDDPRTSKARRALERTYFHGVVSQEAAAEVLDMAFSTYRRHLRTGIELLTDQLWRWEVFGAHDGSSD